MNYAMVKRLVLKDWYLQRWAILASLAGIVATLGIIATGGKVAFLIGLIVLIMVIISIGAQMAVATIVTERKEQTLPFVMSLPISYRDYTACKIWGNLLIFLVPWLTMVVGSCGLLLLSPSSRGLLPYAVIMSTKYC
jgi:ABC-2 type transport system permease protein